jgi:WD40 repeat protein
MPPTPASAPIAPAFVPKVLELRSRAVGGARAGIGPRALLALPGGRLASGSGDGCINVWDATDGRLLSTLHGHSAAVLALLLLPDGRVASGGADATVRIWSLYGDGSGSIERVLSGNAGGVTSLAVIKGPHLATACFAEAHSVKVRKYPIYNVHFNGLSSVPAGVERGHGRV